MFADDVAPGEVAKRLRVTIRSVYRWKAEFQHGGTAALRSKGPLGQRCKLSVRSQARLAAILEGPGRARLGGEPSVDRSPGRAAERAEVHSADAAARLMRRLGFTPQMPARQAVQRNEVAVAAWEETTWPPIRV